MVNKEEEKNIVTSQYGNYGTTRDDEINLYDVWEVIVKRKNIIVALFLISLLGAAIYCFVTPKIYRLETYIKIHTPPGITTVYTIPMAKELSTRLSKIMKELKINNELNTVIFNHNPSDVTDVKIEEVIGTAGAMLSDSLKVTIEAKNREALEAAPRLLVNYIENINEHKVITSKIMSELNEKIALVNRAANESEFQLMAIEKRLASAKVLPVGYDPVTIRQNCINLKMEKIIMRKTVTIG
jgi:capsular polysaccharide biosynthesis protein